VKLFPRQRTHQDTECTVHLSNFLAGHRGCPRCGAGTVPTAATDRLITDEDLAAWLDVKAEVLDTAAAVDPAVGPDAPQRAAEARATADLYRAEHSQATHDTYPHNTPEHALDTGDAEAEMTHAPEPEALTTFQPARPYREFTQDPRTPWWTPDLAASLHQEQFPQDYEGFHQSLEAYQVYDDQDELADHDERALAAPVDLDADEEWDTDAL
jgi:hypothetical protein